MPRKRATGSPRRVTGSPRARAVALLANVISDPEKRRALANNPEATINAELGPNARALPPEVRAFFSELTYEELRVLAQLQQTMTTQTGLYDNIPTSHGNVTLAKF